MSITLAQLEQEVARRTGPYFMAAQDSQTPTTSTTTAAYMPTLKSSAVLGGPENLWLLRRGVHMDGTPLGVDVYDPVDRVRMVQTFDSSAGRVVVDRNWRHPMQPNEVAEFIHLHPDQELRVSTLAGLRRCFFSDRYGLGGFIFEADLTAALPWLIDPNSVTNVQIGWPAAADVPFEVFSECGHVWLRASSGYGGALRITVIRSHFEWVNGTDTVEGPSADTDCLNVDLGYAASAGHIEAWHLFPSHLFAAAAGNLQATQEMAAREFTRQSLIWNPHQPRSIMFNEVVALPL